MRTPSCKPSELIQALIEEKPLGWRQGLSKRCPFVTIAIGILSGGKTPMIVVASDSETTASAYKRLTKKVNIVNFKSGGQMLAAYSGSCTFGNCILNALDDIAAKTDLVGDSGQKAVQDAVRAIFRESMESHPYLERNEGMMKSFLIENNTDMLAAYYSEGKPYLFTVSLAALLKEKNREGFAAIGCGEQFAQHFIDEYREVDPGFDYGLPIAVAVTEKTIDAAKACGRPTQLGIVFPNQEPATRITHGGAQLYHGSEAKIFDRTVSQLFADEILSLESGLQKVRKEILEKSIGEFVSKYPVDDYLH